MGPIIDYETYYVVSRFGEDDVSLWTVDILVEDFNKLSEDVVRTTGELETLLRELPIVDGELRSYLHFLVNDENGHAVLTCEVDNEFIEKYNHCGCSVRSSVEDIMCDYNLMLEETMQRSVRKITNKSSLCDVLDNAIKRSNETDNVQKDVHFEIEK